MMIHERLRRTLLCAILAAYGLVGGLYVVVTPAWQAPDEPAHYNYVRQLAAGDWPIMQMGDWDNAYLEELRSRQFPPTLATPQRLDAIQYEDHQPPLYYLLAAGVYRLADGQLMALRAFSLLLGAGVVLCTYAIGRLLLPKRPGAALGAAALTAMIPQHLAILASVTNDALAYLLVAVTLLVCIRYLSLPLRAPLVRWHIAIGLLVGLALVTKVTVYFLAAVAVLTLMLRPLVVLASRPAGKVASKAFSIANALAQAIPKQNRPEPMRSGMKRNLLGSARRVYMPALRRSAGDVARRAAVVLAIALAFGGLWWARNSAVYGFPDVMGLTQHDVVVVGQLRTAERVAQVGPAAYWQGALQTTYNSFWGQIGWMARPLPGWAYERIGWLLVGALAGLIYDGLWWARMKKRAPTPKQISIGLLLGLTGLAAMAAYVYYNFSFYQVQGRYLFTALIPFALLVGAGVDVWAQVLGRWLRQWRPALAPYTDYLTALLFLLTFGALNLWLLRFVVPTLAPLG